MPPLVAAAAITAGGAIAGGVMQSRAASGASRQQTQAANYSADKQAEASQSAERFQREEAERAWKQSEADRRANYDQWRAREARLGSIGEQLGYGARGIPDYVAGEDPRYTDPRSQVPAGPYQPPKNLPTYAPNTGSDGRAVRSVGEYLQPPPTSQAPRVGMAPPLALPDPNDPRRGSVGYHLRGR